MKHLATIAGAILGLLFAASGVVVLFKLATPPPPAKGSAAEHFMIAFGPTGYFNFIKILEIIGGILVAIPRFRNFGLLILGPIIVNILAFHVFVMKGTGLLEPPVIIVSVLGAYLLWVERKAFAALMKK